MTQWTVTEQRKKFRDDDLFQFLSQGNEIKYVIPYDAAQSLDLEEQRNVLSNDFRKGIITLAFLRSGLNLELSVQKQESHYDAVTKRYHIFSRFILDGVSVAFKGYLCQETLSGVGRIEFDDSAGK